MLTPALGRAGFYAFAATLAFGRLGAIRPASCVASGTWSRFDSLIYE